MVVIVDVFRQSIACVGIFALLHLWLQERTFAVHAHLEHLPVAK